MFKLPLTLLQLQRHSGALSVCVGYIYVCDLLVLVAPKIYKYTCECVSEVMNELLCASLFPIIGFSSTSVCVCVTPLKSSRVGLKDQSLYTEVLI